MLFKYNFDNENNIFLQRIEGEWNIDTYLESIYKLKNTLPWKDVKYIVTDIRGIDMHEALGDVENLGKIKQLLGIESFKNIFYANSPMSTAFAFSYKNKNSNKTANYEVCSTTKYILYFLDQKLTESTLEGFMNNLKLIESNPVEAI